ncbi:transforming growth factor beta receptor type 3-like isoform X2 [Apostichopus japonicus]|uniref:transforming growth factor beta receptor type 3-like isoform X2 n=1 Tax=Stichopus japonicus TaxID=307972 RepID=UPI003AB28AC0
MEAVFRRALQLLLYLSFAISSTVLTDSSKCKIHRLYDSASLQASYREEVAIDRGCVTNYKGLLRQVHVINYKSSLVGGSSQANILLNIDPDPGRTQTRTLVIVLNSNVSVTWEVELLSLENFDVSLFRFVVPQSSSLEFASQSQQFEVVTNSNLPIDDQELLTWVRDEFGNVTSFSAIHDVDEIGLFTAADTGTSTAVCDLSSSQSTVSAFKVEDESIYGCSTTRYDLVNRRQIHVIELLSPRKNLGDGARGTAEVMIQKGRDLQVGNRDTLLVLVAQSPTLWRIRSTAIEGSLTVLTNTHSESGSVGLTDLFMERIPDIVATKKGLLTWVQENYGAVTSYSNIRVANQFVVYLAGPIPDGMLLTPTAFSPDVTPIRDLTSELSRNSELSCLNDRISILVPIGLVVKHGLTPGMVTWRTSSCRSRMTDEGLVLETSYNSCGSRVTRNSDDSLRVSNEVMFLSSDITEGSGMVFSDDEDYNSSTVIDRKPVSCEYLIQSKPEPAEISSEDPLIEGTSLYLDLYTNDKYERRMLLDPYRVEIGDPLYLEMGVTKDERLSIIMNDCWLGIDQAKSLYNNIYRLTLNGCPQDPTLEYLPVSYPSYRITSPPGMVKQFTFDVPFVDSDVMTFFLFCNLSLCSQKPIRDEPQIIPCSEVPGKGADCSEWKDLNFWPQKNVEIGPFRIISREKLDRNITRGFSSNCNNKEGMVVTPAIFIVVVITAFVMGVILVSSIWIITKHIMPSPPAATSAPVSNGHLQNGHLPNGEAAHEMQAFLPAVGGVNPNNIPHEGFYNGPEPQV